MFYERLKLLAKENKKSFNDIEQDLGFSKNLLYKYNKYEPKQETLNQLAKYFDVSTDYLLGNTDQRTTLTNQLEQIINREYLPLSNSEKQSVHDVMQLLFEEEKYKKTLGYRIRNIRKKLELSQEEFPFYITKNATAKTGEQWENNSLKPTSSELKKIADMAYISVKYLLTGKPDLIDDPAIEVAFDQVANYAEHLDEKTYSKLVRNVNNAFGVLTIIMERSMLWWQEIHDIEEVDGHEIPTLIENLETYSQINHNLFQIISSRGNYQDRISRQEKNIPELKDNIEKLIEINSRVATKDFYDEGY